MACLLTNSLNNSRCEYSFSGVRDLYLANYHGMREGSEAAAGSITYTKDGDGLISQILLPEGEYFYKIEGTDGTMNYQDALAVGGNGNKYRMHTVTAVLSMDDIEVINQSDALSLGRFIAVVIDKMGKIKVLGRTGGLSAPADGVNFDSGSAVEDASGWTIILSGESGETAPLVESEAVITPIFTETVTP